MSSSIGGGATPQLSLQQAQRELQKLVDDLAKSPETTETDKKIRGIGTRISDFFLSARAERSKAEKQCNDLLSKVNITDPKDLSGEDLRSYHAGLKELQAGIANMQPKAGKQQETEASKAALNVMKNWSKSKLDKAVRLADYQIKYEDAQKSRDIEKIEEILRIAKKNKDGWKLDKKITEGLEKTKSELETGGKDERIAGYKRQAQEALQGTPEKKTDDEGNTYSTGRRIPNLETINAVLKADQTNKDGWKLEPKQKKELQELQAKLSKQKASSAKQLDTFSEQAKKISFDPTTREWLGRPGNAQGIIDYFNDMYEQDYSKTYGEEIKAFYDQFAQQSALAYAIYTKLCKENGKDPVEYTDFISSRKLALTEKLKAIATGKPDVKDSKAALKIMQGAISQLDKARQLIEKSIKQGPTVRTEKEIKAYREVYEELSKKLTSLVPDQSKRKTLEAGIVKPERLTFFLEKQTRLNDLLRWTPGSEHTKNNIEQIKGLITTSERETGGWSIDPETKKQLKKRVELFEADPQPTVGDLHKQLGDKKLKLSASEQTEIRQYAFNKILNLSKKSDRQELIDSYTRLERAIRNFRTEGDLQDLAADIATQHQRVKSVTSDQVNPSLNDIGSPNFSLSDALKKAPLSESLWWFDSSWSIDTALSDIKHEAETIVDPRRAPKGTPEELQKDYETHYKNVKNILEQLTPDAKQKLKDIPTPETIAPKLKQAKVAAQAQTKQERVAAYDRKLAQTLDRLKSGAPAPKPTEEAAPPKGAARLKAAAGKLLQRKAPAMQKVVQQTVEADFFAPEEESVTLNKINELLKYAKENKDGWKLKPADMKQLEEKHAQLSDMHEQYRALTRHVFDDSTIEQIRIAREKNIPITDLKKPMNEQTTARYEALKKLHKKLADPSLTLPSWKEFSEARGEALNAQVAGRLKGGRPQFEGGRIRGGQPQTDEGLQLDAKAKADKAKMAQGAIEQFDRRARRGELTTEQARERTPEQSAYTLIEAAIKEGRIEDASEHLESAGAAYEEMLKEFVSPLAGTEAEKIMQSGDIMRYGKLVDILQHEIPPQGDESQAQLREITTLLDAATKKTGKWEVDPEIKKQLEMRKTLLTKQPEIEDVRKQIADPKLSDLEKRELKQYAIDRLTAGKKDPQMRKKQITQLTDAVVTFASSTTANERAAAKKNMLELIKGHANSMNVEGVVIKPTDVDPLQLLEKLWWVDTSPATNEIVSKIKQQAREMAEVTLLTDETAKEDVAQYKAAYQSAEEILKALVPDQKKRAELMKGVDSPATVEETLKKNIVKIANKNEQQAVDLIKRLIEQGKELRTGTSSITDSATLKEAIEKIKEYDEQSDKLKEQLSTLIPDPKKLQTLMKGVMKKEEVDKITQRVMTFGKNLDKYELYDDELKAVVNSQPDARRDVKYLADIVRILELERSNKEGWKIPAKEKELLETRLKKRPQELGSAVSQALGNSATLEDIKIVRDQVKYAGARLSMLQSYRLNAKEKELLKQAGPQLKGYNARLQAKTQTLDDNTKMQVIAALSDTKGVKGALRRQAEREYKELGSLAASVSLPDKETFIEKRLAVIDSFVETFKKMSPKEKEKMGEEIFAKLALHKGKNEELNTELAKLEFPQRRDGTYVKTYDELRKGLLAIREGIAWPTQREVVVNALKVLIPNESKRNVLLQKLPPDVDAAKLNKAITDLEQTGWALNAALQELNPGDEHVSELVKAVKQYSKMYSLIEESLSDKQKGDFASVEDLEAELTRIDPTWDMPELGESSDSEGAETPPTATPSAARLSEETPATPPAATATRQPLTTYDLDTLFGPEDATEPAQTAPAATGAEPSELDNLLVNLQKALDKVPGPSTPAGSETKSKAKQTTLQPPPPGVRRQPHKTAESQSPQTQTTTSAHQPTASEPEDLFAALTETIKSFEPPTALKQQGHKGAEPKSSQGAEPESVAEPATTATPPKESQSAPERTSSEDLKAARSAADKGEASGGRGKRKKGKR